MKKEDFKKINIPDSPGIYFFKKGKEILYIGKATSLKDRIKSYFGKDPEGKQASYGVGLIESRGPLIVKMVQDADKIDWQKTDSMLEALILEATLIKKYQPKYNTKEKSDKSFNYVCITKSHLRHGVDDLPKILVVRGKNIENKIFDEIFGPYPNGSQLREAMKIVRRIFPFLDEKSRNYMEFYRQINLVPDLNDKKLYLQNIKNIKLFFSGKKKKILNNLKKEMKVYAKNKEFEKAGEIKRQLFALQHINDIALIKNNSFVDNKIFDPAPFFGRIKGERIEAYDIAHMFGKNMVGVMVVVEDGEIEKSEYKKFKIKTQAGTNDTGALKEVLERRFKHTEWPHPELIVVDGGIAQINITKVVLAKNGLNITVVSVLKDERHKAKAILLPPFSRPDLKGAQGLAFIKKHKREILLANNEAHRFAIAYHKKLRNKNFLK